jgi:hypothetical protein
LMNETGQDQYDLILNKLTLAARVKKFPGERAGENSLALHSTLGSLGLSVTERDLHGDGGETLLLHQATSHHQDH